MDMKFEESSTGWQRQETDRSKFMTTKLHADFPHLHKQGTIRNSPCMKLRHRWPDTQRITLIWHYLAFDKDISIAKTFRQLETVKQNTLGLIKRIESTTTFPTQVSPLCDWCEYKEICPAMKKR